MYRTVHTNITKTDWPVNTHRARTRRRNQDLTTTTIHVKRKNAYEAQLTLKLLV